MPKPIVINAGNLEQLRDDAVLNSGTIQFNTSANVPTFANGQVFWDTDNACLAFQTSDDVTIQIGQETVLLGFNATAATISNGHAVYLNDGSTDGHPDIANAVANDAAAAFAIGVATQNIAPNSAGYVCIRGIVHEMDTSAWAEGDILYLSTIEPGHLTNAQPVAPDYDVKVARVLTVGVSDGSIYVNIRQLVRLVDLCDVTTTTPVVDEILRFNGVEWVNGSPPGGVTGPGIDMYPATPVITASSANNAYNISTYSKTPVTTPQVVRTGSVTNTTVILEAYLYEPDFQRIVLDGGTWTFYCYGSVSSTGQGRSSYITRNMYRVIPSGAVTVTTTGTGTSRTATASGGTFFDAADANADTKQCGYLQIDGVGIYPITARASATSVTITTLTGMTNQSTKTFKKWERLFGQSTAPITSLNTNYTLLTSSTAQPSFTVAATDKLGAIVFAVGTDSGDATTVSFCYNSELRSSHDVTPMITLHNNLAGLQGGTASEMYHLTANQATIATQAATSGQAGYLTAADWTAFAAGDRIKAWVNFDGDGTVTITDSYNVASVSDNGTGAYTINFTANMADTTYAVIGTARRGDTNNNATIVMLQSGQTKTAAAVRIKVADVTGTILIGPIFSAYDSPEVNVIIVSS
jgi:hypothetical protein